MSDRLLDENGKPFDIPEGGTLGLLALGYVGLMAWRQRRAELRAASATTTALSSSESTTTIDSKEKT